MGNLVAETLTNTGGTTTTKFAYDNGNIYADLTGSGTVTTVYDTGAATGLFARIQSGTVYWIGQDYLGSVRVIINAAGTAILDAVTYTDSGGISSQTNGSALGNFGYTGLRFDSVTGFNVAQARWYNPTIGQWLEIDPAGLAGGLSNFRSYVGGNFTNATDPSGLEEKPLGYPDLAAWDPKRVSQKSPELPVAATPAELKAWQEEIKQSVDVMQQKRERWGVAQFFGAPTHDPATQHEQYLRGLLIRSQLPTPWTVTKDGGILPPGLDRQGLSSDLNVLQNFASRHISDIAASRRGPVNITELEALRSGYINVLESLISEQTQRDQALTTTSLILNNLVGSQDPADRGRQKEIFKRFRQFLDDEKKAFDEKTSNLPEPIRQIVAQRSPFLAAGSEKLGNNNADIYKYFKPAFSINGDTIDCFWESTPALKLLQMQQALTMGHSVEMNPENRYKFYPNLDKRFSPPLNDTERMAWYLKYGTNPDYSKHVMTSSQGLQSDPTPLMILAPGGVALGGAKTFPGGVRAAASDVAIGTTAAAATESLLEPGRANEQIAILATMVATIKLRRSYSLAPSAKAAGGAGIAPTGAEGVLRTRSLRQIRTLIEQGNLNVSQETLGVLRALEENPYHYVTRSGQRISQQRIEVAAADLQATLPRMAELQRAAQVEFALIEQEGRYFLIRGLPEEVYFGTRATRVIAHTQPGPPGFMALRPSLDDLANLPVGQNTSIIIGADGRWIRFSRTGPRTIVGGGHFDTSSPIIQP